MDEILQTWFQHLTPNSNQSIRMIFITIYCYLIQKESLYLSLHCLKNITSSYVNNNKNFVWVNGPQQPLMTHFVYTGLLLASCYQCWQPRRQRSLFEMVNSLYFVPIITHRYELLTLALVAAPPSLLPIIVIIECDGVLNLSHKHCSRKAKSSIKSL